MDPVALAQRHNGTTLQLSRSQSIQSKQAQAESARTSFCLKEASFTLKGEKD